MPDRQTAPKCEKQINDGNRLIEVELTLKQVPSAKIIHSIVWLIKSADSAPQTAAKGACQPLGAEPAVQRVWMFEKQTVRCSHERIFRSSSTYHPNGPCLEEAPFLDSGIIVHRQTLAEPQPKWYIMIGHREDISFARIDTASLPITSSGKRAHSVTMPLQGEKDSA
ncbi:hypothetical protein AYL99_07279 [Fonsecaea erecta]|uniref:Uncharacterized protein n=1 Tax=Fonsecaea erecta TaxID=1367422 RepID=A0A178ZEH9_9EURO|nr:hypothetical protein AYL99_07279 [Fonsecaea erecta]OAP58189.1 hypothetical protein AYL99_07279 [Fonsecaea erecta]